MPAKEIKELRQLGLLDEALKMANEELKVQPDNIWGKRNISWVYYEYLKVNASIKNVDVFIKYLLKLKELKLPEGESMVFDSTAFQIGKVVFALNKLEQSGFSKVNQILDIIKSYHFTKSAESYSFLYKAFHKGYKNWEGYIDFADWWDFDNFIDKDYAKEKMPNGNEVMSIVEQAFIAYPKKLLEGKKSNAFSLNRDIDKIKIKHFISKLDKVIYTHPEYQYAVYFKVKLLLAIDSDKENLLSVFIPFAKKKRNEFWVWDLMAEIFKDDVDLQLASYCKALSLKAKKDFLIKTREKLVRVLVSKKLFDEAKTEINNIIKVREENSWRIPHLVTECQKEIWYKNSTAKVNNILLYNKHLAIADTILHKDIPEYLVSIEFVNHNKNILNFVMDKSMYGFFNYEGFIINPEIGDVLKVRLDPIGKDHFYRVLTAEKVENIHQLNVASIKEVSGVIEIPEAKNFGFVDDIFVPPNLIENHKLLDKQNIIIKAVLSFNKSREKWGWKAVSVLT